MFSQAIEPTRILAEPRLGCSAHAMLGHWLGVRHSGQVTPPSALRPSHTVRLTAAAPLGVCRAEFCGSSSPHESQHLELAGRMASVANAFALLSAGDDAPDVDVNALAAAAPVSKPVAPAPAATEDAKGERVAIHTSLHPTSSRHAAPPSTTRAECVAIESLSPE